MSAKKKRTGVEWVGGLVSMPAYVTGDGDPYRPDVLLWMSAEGAVLGHTTGKPGAVVGLASESLRSTIARPMVGLPHAPQRVRVASPALAEALRAGHAGLEVVCAPTPEIDAVLAEMREQMDEGAEAEQSYLSTGVGPDAIAALFHAAAALFRSKPWKTVPSDQSLFSVTIEQLGVKDAALSIIGQMGQSFGFIVFSGVDDFEAYAAAGDAMEHGEEPEMPPHFALNFERGAELGAALRKEIAEHRWEVAGAQAYPWLWVVDEDLLARPAVGREVAIAEAIALALPKVLEEEQALLAAWNGGEPVSRTLSVPAHAGDLEVALRVPCRQDTADRLPDGVLADLAELAEDAQDGEEIDREARRPLEDELVRRFEGSPEAKALTDLQACRFVMDLAADYFSATIATLGPRELREIMFEIIPRKVSIDASEASWMIEETRAFYAFLEREFGLPQAGACRRVLGGDAVKKLEAALSDTSKFGMAKSLVMRGREAGFDMESKEGIEAWMRVMQSQPLPPSIGLPSPRPPSRAADKGAAQAKRNQRKAARKARKRNR
jgi:hypothetical protein